MSERLGFSGLAGFLIALSACGDDGTGGSGNSGGAGGSGAGHSTGATGGGGSSGDGGSTGGAGVGGTGVGGSGGGTVETCLGSNLLADLNVNHLMVGVATFEPTTAAEPFDLQYRYLSGGYADGDGPCDSCATGCTASGQNCSNAGGGCSWWGCWQYDQDPPGAYVRSFVTDTLANGQIPMITYYEILQASGVAEGSPEVVVMNDAAFLRRFFNDVRFLLQQIGNNPAIFHPEPDFWGYAEQMNPDPHAIPAAVQSANPTDCAGEENSIAGLGRCLVTMTHKYAPNAKIGLHGSPWATNYDVVQNSDPGFDVAGHAAQLGTFLSACGPDADLVIIDGSDRDAGYDQANGQDTWWDATNQSLPNFHQAFAWSSALSVAMGKPNLWWQLPVGNSNLPDVPNQWKDNRVEYFMAHMDEVAAAHGVGAAFGAGQGDQTSAETDGGLLISLVQSYDASGGEPLCP
ncbi:MAG: hypothetical protein U0271_25255 [Polyangiaceae bacterium]